jgi:DNA-binding SARP family transcriptional activator
MRLRLLGPLEIDDVADEALLRRANPRALLALLLLSANRPVGTDRLVAGLWGEQEPATALGALQNYVSQLRKALGRDVVVTRAPGYMAVVAPDELDVERFERLVAEAADSDLTGRAARLREALSLWRGPPLADLADGRSPARRSGVSTSCASRRWRIGSPPTSSSDATAS